MRIKTLVLGEVSTNCYIIMNEATREVIIIDPADHAEIIDKYFNEQGLKPVAILLTHGHFDHIFAVNELVKTYNIPVYASSVEQELLLDASMNCSSFSSKKAAVTISHSLNDNDKITLAGMDITIIHTPGHTAGGVCYYFEKDGVLFSGDTLFYQTIGRTDLPTGNYKTLIDSVNNKLMKLPDDVQVYPGHEQSTTIGYERRNNPYVS